MEIARFRILPACFLLFISFAATAGSENFSPYPGQVTVAGGRLFTLADFNGDDAPDLVAVVGPFLPGSTVQFFMNDGVGGLLEAGSVDFTGGVSAIEVAALNEDDASDVLVKRSNDGEETVDVLLGDGNGNFLLHGSHVLGSSAAQRRIFLGDINSDGISDIVWVNAANSSGRIVLGDGSGGFIDGQEFDTPDPFADISIADINSDGWPDIFLASEDTEVFYVRMNDGDGSLTDPLEHAVEYPVDGTVVDIDVGDVTGDGRLDVAMAGSEGDISILAGIGSGDFLACPQFSVGFEAKAVSLLDISGDGIREIVTVSDRETEIHFAHATHVEDADDGEDVSYTEACEFYGAASLRQLGSNFAIADITRDGAPDLVTVHADGIEVITGNGLSFSSRKPFFYGWRSADVDLVDVTGDDILDIVSSSFENHKVWVVSGDGAGGVTEYDWYDAFGFPMDIDAADVTGDGIPDLVVANGARDSISVLRGTGTGDFLEAEEFSAGDKPWVLAIADVTGDGKNDVLTGNFDSDSVSLLENDGAGGFLAAVELAVDVEPRTLLVANVTGDEHLDMIVKDPASEFISILIGDGEGGFSPAEDYPAPGCEIFVADLTGDNVSDVVCADDDGIRAIDLGADATAVPGVSAPALEAQRGFVLDDVNEDDWLDVLSIDTDAHIVIARLGDGSGGYLRELVFATEEYPYDVTVGDMTGDGRLDIVTTHNRADDLHGFAGTVLLPYFNRAPVAAGMEIRIDADGQTYGVLPATDPENEPLTYKIVDRPKYGDLTFSDSAGRVFSYQMNSDAYESDKFTFAAYDGTNSSNAAVVRMQRNRAPVAMDGSVEVDVGGIVLGTMHATDPDGDAMTFSIETGPRHGLLTIIDPATGSFRYELQDDSDDDFSFVVTDGKLNSNVAFVVVHSHAGGDDNDDDDDEGDGGEPDEEPDPVRPQPSNDQGGGGASLAFLLMLAFFRHRGMRWLRRTQ